MTNHHHHRHQAIFVELTVPPGAEAGVDSLTFQCAGSELEVPIPPGSVAGDVLRIQVGLGGDSDNDDDHDAEGAIGGVDGEAGGERDASGSVDDAKEGSRPSGHGPMDEPGRIGDGVPSDLKGDDVEGGPLLDPSGKTCDNNSSNGFLNRGSNATPAKDGRGDEGLAIVELGDGLASENGTAISLRLLESLADSMSEQSCAGRGRVDGDGTHGVVWASGKFLAQVLTSSLELRGVLPSERPVGDGELAFNCLELGSGSGVCGLALAHALASREILDGCGRRCLKASILLTDRGEDAVRLLGENIKRNPPTSARPGNHNGSPVSCGITLAAGGLRWGGPLRSEKFGTEERFHLILGSDLLYNTRESYLPLVSTMKRHLHPEVGAVLLAVRWRKPDLERKFFRLAEKEGLAFDLWREPIDDPVLGKRCPCRLGWRDYGDPSCNASNTYFHEHKVSVAGEERSLATVTEDDMVRMDDGEYLAFDEMQVQIYVATYMEGAVSRLKKRRREVELS